MKLLIASDIHGSQIAAERIRERYEAENAEGVILLGDIYNPGPRHGLPEGYAPMKVAEIINAFENLTVIKGNCDSEVDIKISDFAFVDCAVLYVGKKRVFLTHGHRYHIDNIPKNCDALIYGHKHTGFITEKDGKIIANAGSAAIPKNGTEKSYLLLDGNTLYLKSLTGEVLEKREI